MARMDGKGPEEKGRKAGRGLGTCPKEAGEKGTAKLGVGMGLRRRKGGGAGNGKRRGGGSVLNN